MNGKSPLYLSLLLAAVLTTAMLLAQPYSSPSHTPPPWQAYNQPAREYLRAASRKDSLGLVRRSVSSAPVAWALAVARRKPESLAAWAHGAEVWTGRRLGDTTEVLLQQPIWLRFLGSGEEVKVVEAGSLSREPSGIDRRFSGFLDLPY